MDHDDHVRLIRNGVEGGGTRWADLGSGSGAFTLALAEILGPGGVIHSVDVDADALHRQAAAFRARFPAVAVSQHVADFRDLPPLAELDGVVMANSLHFVAAKRVALAGIVDHLRPDGRFVLVEYDTDLGNRWVPHPLSYETWTVLAAEVGLRETRRVASVPSRFLGSIYSALSIR